MNRSYKEKIRYSTPVMREIVVVLERGFGASDIFSQPDKGNPSFEDGTDYNL